MISPELKEEFRGRLKDVIWNLRQRHPLSGLSQYIDRWFIFLALHDSDWTLEQLEKKFVQFPHYLPQDIVIVVANYIQDTVRGYWWFCQDGSGRTRLAARIRFLEEIARQGLDVYVLEKDNRKGWRLVEKK